VSPPPLCYYPPLRYPPLQVDTSHPELIGRWLAQDADALAQGVELVRWLPDLSGRPRFCELRWGGAKAPGPASS